MAKWHKGSIREKNIDIKLRLRQMSEDIDAIIEDINQASVPIWQVVNSNLNKEKFTLYIYEAKYGYIFALKKN